MFSYKGSKKSELPAIREQAPHECTTLVDVFGGSGMIAIGLSDLYKNTVYNEINPNCTAFIEFLKKSGNIEKLLKFVESLTKEKAIDLFNRFVEKLKLGRASFPIETYLYFMLNFRSQFTFMCHTDKIKSLPRHVKKLMEFRPVIRNIEVKNKDYREILKEYENNSEAFLYLDPPYLAETKTMTNYYQNIKPFTIGDYEFMAEFMKRAKCKVLLNCEYTAFAREELTTDLEVTAYKHQFSSRISNSKNRYPHYQLFIRNYSLPNKAEISQKTKD